MSIKRALIVDDSKTAQFKLKKVLDAYELEVDFALSAEDALSYLAYQVPDILFMDHSMKGMSGLEAVKIIKANSLTATIPVVMYTAEKGDVYLSQARAIGAMDVISKEVMADSDIQRVMKSVNIKLVRKSVTSNNDTTLSPRPIERSGNDFSRQFARISEQVSQSIRLQQSHISRDIQDNTRLITRRFMSELRSMQIELKQGQKQQQEFVKAVITPEEKPKKASILWSIVPWVLLLSVAIYSALQLSQIERDNAQLRDNYRELASELTNQNNAVLAGLKKVKTASVSQSRSEMRSDKLLAGLIWAINQNSQYDFSKQALGDQRISLVSSLINFLDQANFRGTLTLGIHSGNFCVVENTVGQLVLPENDAAGANCRLLATYNRDFSSVPQTSTSFINFLNTSPAVESGRLKVNIQSYGITSPISQYPTYSDNIDTNEWNSIAETNNRLSIELSPG